jgi:RNA polymerase sigma-70 factor (ECF subfamily)
VASLRKLLWPATEPAATVNPLADDPRVVARLAQIEAELAEGLPFAAEPDLALFAAARANTLDHAANVEAGVAALAQLAVADLYLAAACARGDSRALRWFERSCGPELDRVIARSPGLGLSAAEFGQLVIVRLVLAEPERQAKILSYRGQGSLRAWVRVTAARLVIDLSRRRAEPAGSDALLDQLSGGEDLELEHLRGRFGPELQASFAAALAQLSVRQRNLLRQRHIHDISADALARLYAVHRSTVFVWLEQARVALLGHIRTALLARVPGHELDSVVGVLGSRLDVSVRRLLDSRLEPEARA